MEDKKGRLAKCIGEKRQEICNNIKENKEGEFTFTRGRGSTVIDYVLEDKKVREKTEMVNG